MVCALLLVTAFQPAWPDASNEFYENALRRAAEDDTAGAIIELQNALRVDRDYLPAWVSLANLHLKRGSGSLAEIALVKAAKLGADPTLTLVPLARAYLLQSKFAELAALEAPPNFEPRARAELLTVQGNALLAQGKFKDAQAKYQSAATDDPRLPAPLWGEIMARIGLGELAGAATLAERVVNEYPDAPESWYLRAEVQRQRGEAALARESFRAALQRNSRHVPAAIGLVSLLLDSDDLDAARTELESLNRLAPDDIQVQYLLAVLKARQGDVAGANAVLKSVATNLASHSSESLSRHPPSLMIGGILAIRAREFNRAARYFHKYLESAPKHPAARRLLAVALLNANVVVEARRLLLDLARDYPNDGYIRALLGTVHMRLGMTDRALKSFVEAIARGFDDQGASATLEHLSASMPGWSIYVPGAASGEDADELAWGGFVPMQSRMSQNTSRSALEGVETLLKQGPDNASYHNFAGVLHLILQNTAAADREFQAALKLRPDYLPARLNFAELARQTGAAGVAELRYREILRDDPDDPRALSSLAELLWAQGRPETAIPYSERVVAVFPSAITDRIRLIQLYMETGEKQRAFDELKRLESAYPDEFDVAFAATMLLLQTGDRKSAERRLPRLLELSGETPRYILETVRLQLALGLKVEAARLLEARPLPVDDPYIAYEVGKLEIAAGSIAAAAARADALLAEFPELSYGRELKGRLMSAQGHHAEAVGYLERLIEDSPDSGQDTGALLALSDARAGAGDFAQAVADLELLVAKYPNDIVFSTRLALACLRAGQLQRAMQLYEAVLPRAQHSKLVRNNLVWLYAKLKDPRALAGAEELREMYPNDAAVLDTVGMVLLEHGRAEAALALLEKASNREPHNPQIEFHLARAYLLQGNTKAARSLLETVATNAEFAERQEAQALLDGLPDVR